MYLGDLFTTVDGGEIWEYEQREALPFTRRAKLACDAIEVRYDSIYYDLLEKYVEGHHGPTLAYVTFAKKRRGKGCTAIDMAIFLGLME